MKKKWIAIVSAIIVLATSVALLAACNPASVEDLSKNLEKNEFMVTAASAEELESMSADDLQLDVEIEFKGKITGYVTAIKDEKFASFIYFAAAEDAQAVYDVLKQARDEAVTELQNAYNKANDEFKKAEKKWKEMEESIAKDAAKVAVDLAQETMNAAKNALDQIKDASNVVKKGNAIGFGHKDAVKFL